MRLRDARKLHNRDQVRIKGCRPKQYAVILNTWTDAHDPETLVVEMLADRDGYQQMTHRDIA